MTSKIADVRAQEGILREIIEERIRQDEQWGGVERDDVPDLRDSRVAEFECLPLAERRERFVKIAAMALAAVERMDRQAAKKHT